MKSGEQTIVYDPLIKRLEHYLMEAKSGRIKAMGFVSVHSDGKNSIEVCADDDYRPNITAGGYALSEIDRQGKPN